MNVWLFLAVTAVALSAGLMYVEKTTDWLLPTITMQPYTQPKVQFLPSGRALSYRVFGSDDPGAAVVIHNHPSPTSSIFVHIHADRILKEENIRLIAVDRPGIAWSSPHSLRTLESFAQDVFQFADAQNIACFSVTGHSSGATYALAIAALDTAKKVKKVGLVGPVVPFSYFADTNQTINEVTAFMRPENGLIYKVGETAPWLIPYMFYAMSMFGNSEAGLRSMVEDVARLEGERPILQQKQWRELFYASHVESFRQGSEGTAVDSVLCSKPFGFSLKDVTQTVLIWVGREDKFTPPNLAHRLAGLLPNKAGVLEVEGMGHYAAWGHMFHEIMKAMK